MLTPFQYRGPFPIQHAFVVQFAVDTGLDDADLAGRVEHVASGQAMHFQSLEELLAFVTRILRALTTPEDT